MSIFNEPKWVILDSKGEFTDQVYSGNFLMKPYLTHAEKADAARLAEIYCRGITRNEGLVSFLTTLAYLKFYIIETDAKWWEDKYDNNGLSAHDEQPVWDLSDKLGEIRSPGKGGKTDDPGGSETPPKGKKKTK